MTKLKDYKSHILYRIRLHKMVTRDIDSVSKFTNDYFVAKEYYDMYRKAGGKVTFSNLFKSVKIKKY